MTHKTTLVMIFALLFSSVVFAEVPRIMNYQGKLTDASGVAVLDTTGSPCAGRIIGFQIYDVSTGGTPLWAETLCVRIVKGLFDVTLGNTHPINLDFSVPYYMELVVDNDDDGSISTTADTLLPREKLAPVSFAYRSIYADTADYVEGGAGDNDWVVSGDGTSPDTVYNLDDYIGIGTASPGARLEVNGDIKLSGSSPTYTVTNVRNPTDPSDVATKEYVDSLVGARTACTGHADTDWGDGPEGCDGSNQRCFDGNCVTCSGWMNAGYCWYQGLFDQDCNQVCNGRGGVYWGNCAWVNDPHDCSTCAHWHSYYDFCDNGYDRGPYYQTGYYNNCYYHGSSSGDCGWHYSNKQRICACNM